jgi:hypothetical protein
MTIKKYHIQLVGLCSIFLSFLLFTFAVLFNNTRSAGTYFSIGAGFNDNIVHQLVRADDDKLYVFAGASQYSTTVKAYWTTVIGIPTATSDFTGTTSFTESNDVISTEVVYGGGTIIHVIVNTQGGKVMDHPFDTDTHTFKTAIQIASDSHTVSGDYIGSQGVSAMFDGTGELHVAYWSSTNHITYKSYTYDSGTNALTTVNAATQIDTSGTANHPALAISPLDDSITIAWVSQATSPAKILVKTSSDGASFGTAQQASASSGGDPWVSDNFGKNIDQGPSLVITTDGKKHLLYMETFDGTGEYGRMHYSSTTGSTWTDQETDFYSHAASLAINSGGEMYILGHGHPNNSACTSMTDNVCSVKYNGTTWNTPQIFATATAGQNLDSGASTKWSAYHWNRPETIEFMYFEFSGFTLYYGTIAGAATPTPTNTPTPTSTVTPTPTVAATATATPTPVTVVYTVPANDRDAWSGDAHTGNPNHEVRIDGYNSTDEPHEFVSNDGDAETGAMEFQLTIPPNSTITNAFFTITAGAFQSHSATGAMQINVYDVGNATAFTNGFNGDLLNHQTPWATTVSWPETGSWTNGQTYNSSDITTLVQHIVNKVDYASGNYIGFAITEGTIASGKYYGWLDYFGGSPATLTVSYISSETPTPTPTATTTFTPTLTNTNTPTNTPTPIPPTSTNTPTLTFTPTPTDTPTPTNTNTPTPTPIPPTATNTPTNTPTPTDSFTPIPTDTSTPVPTGTNTPIPTNTESPTSTQTETPTVTISSSSSGDSATQFSSPESFDPTEETSHLFITQIGNLTTLSISTVDSSSVPTSPVIVNTQNLTVSGIAKAGTRVTCAIDTEGINENVAVSASSKFIWNAPRILSYGTYILTCHVEDNGKRRSIAAFNVQIAQKITTKLAVSNTAVTTTSITKPTITNIPLYTPTTTIAPLGQIPSSNTKKLAITVKDTKGNPFPNVLVTLYSNPKTAITNHKGIAEFNDVEPGQHTLNFAMSGVSASQLIAVSDDPTIQQVSIAATLSSEDPFLQNVKTAGIGIGAGIGVILLFFGIRYFIKRKETTS